MTLEKLAIPFVQLTNVAVGSLGILILLGAIGAGEGITLFGGVLLMTSVIVQVIIRGLSEPSRHQEQADLAQGCQRKSSPMLHASRAS